MKNLAILFMPILTLLGCKKNEVPNAPQPPYYQLATEGLSYIQLPVNSYYIYQDSATGTEDSVVVVTSTLRATVVPGQGGLFSGYSTYSSQVYTLKLKSARSTDFWFSGTASAGSSEIFSMSTFHNSLIYSVFIYPLTDRFISSMIVEGKSYANIEKYEFDHQSTVATENISGVYYWAKGVGIIKRQIKTPGTIKTESLIRHG